MKKIISFAILSILASALFAQNINKKDEQGRKQGYWENITPLGKKVYSGHFKDGYPEGEMIRYHKNGAIKARLIFSNKGKSAKAQLYSSYEQLSATGHYIDKKKDSLWRYFDKYEQIRIVEYYTNGKKDGLSTYYYPNGQTFETYEYQNDLKDGYWMRFDRDGNKVLRAHFKNGKLEGCLTTYYKNGVIKVDGLYKNNMRHEKWIFYTIKGEIDKTIHYRNGIADNQDELDEIHNHEIDSLEANKNKDIDPAHFIENPTEHLMKQRRK